MNPDQVMKGQVASAMQADAADGASTGLRRLEQAVADNFECVYASTSADKRQKLVDFASSVGSWLVSEPGNVLRSSSPLSVTCHATFGRLKAEVLLSCTCSSDASAADGASRANCSLHTEKPALSDLIYEVTRHVHGVFNDRFICFTNLFAETLSTGRLAHSLL